MGLVWEVPGAEEAATGVTAWAAARAEARAEATRAGASEAGEVEVAGGWLVARVDVPVAPLELTGVACKPLEAARLLGGRVNTRSGLTGPLSGVAAIR